MILVLISGNSSVVLWAAFLLCLAAHMGLYLVHPSRGTPYRLRKGRRITLSLAAMSLLLSLSWCMTAIGSAGWVVWLSIWMLAASTVVLIGPLIAVPSDGPLRRLPSSRRRGRLRYPWSRQEAWSKGSVGLLGGCFLFVVISLWLPVTLPRLGGSLELALALATWLTIPTWAGFLGWALLARSGVRVWLVLLLLLAALGTTIFLAKS